ncbi:MAG: hypothetical protein A2052_07815 [Deltaproteobacteria bacterium GWA2_54_12]|nr:MAG: hypothetical protein A2052_07815 [Deltaproteobacteria bacterium GWA2_54_12]
MYPGIQIGKNNKILQDFIQQDESACCGAGPENRLFQDRHSKSLLKNSLLTIHVRIAKLRN